MLYWGFSLFWRTLKEGADGENDKLSFLNLSHVSYRLLYASVSSNVVNRSKPFVNVWCLWSRMLKKFGWVVFLVQQSGCWPVLQVPKIWLLLQDLFPSSFKWLLTCSLSASDLLPSDCSLSYSSWLPPKQWHAITAAVQVCACRSNPKMRSVEGHIDRHALHLLRKLFHVGSFGGECLRQDPPMWPIVGFMLKIILSQLSEYGDFRHTLSALTCSGTYFNLEIPRKLI